MAVDATNSKKEVNLMCITVQRIKIGGKKKNAINNKSAVINKNAHNKQTKVRNTH